MERLTIRITSQMAERIREAVASGQYRSPSELIRDALQEWELSRARREQALRELRAEIEKGLADYEAGRVTDFDAEEIIREARGRSSRRNFRSG
jgi:putative addiction module CopG family antidote